MTVQEVKHTLKQWFDRDHRWMSVPVAVATVLVLLVLIKSCQGIVYLQTNECRIYQLGYPIEEARALVAVLSEEQANSFIAGKEYDYICEYDYVKPEDNAFVDAGGKTKVVSVRKVRTVKVSDLPMPIYRYKKLLNMPIED